MWRKIFISGLAAIVMAGAAAAQSLVPLPPQPEDLAWPTDGWEAGEMPAETAELVQPLIDKAMTGKLEDAMGETRAIVIVHHGKVVAETYADGFGPDTKQISWSMAKSVTSALAGRAVQLGLIDDIDAPMPTPFDAGDPRADITWRQWLTMTDGLDYHEIDAESLMTNDVVQMMYGRGRFDVLEYIKEELPPLHEPGTVWNYSTAGFHLIGRAVQGALIRSHADSVREETGMVRIDWMPGEWESESGEMIQDILFTPLGMNAQVEFDSAGTYLGGSLVWASARDFAKFGYLYLRGGMWDGTRLLPEGWVDFSRSHPEAPKENVYGAGFWLTTGGEDPFPDYQRRDAPPWDSFAAEGHEGQTIYIVPSRDLVIVRLGLMSNEGENWPRLFRWNQAVASAFPVVGTGEDLIP